jgi:DNA-binding NarL/FixJ family response regulator
MKDKIKMIIADDEQLFRSGISFLLQREENIEILFEASNGQQVIDYLKSSENYPDIILMDLKMPELNGVEATKIIQKYFPEIKVIALSSYNSNSFIINMIQVGASSYLVKSSTPEEMIFTVKEVADKGFYYNDFVLQVIQENIEFNGTKSKSTFDSDYLTMREKEILLLICKQLNTVEISEKTHISTRTVEGHRNNLMVKTGSKNVAGLAVYALQNGLVDMSEL